MAPPRQYGGGTHAGNEDRELSKFYHGNLFKAGLYVPLHPELFAEPRWHEWLHPSFVRAHAKVEEIQAAAAAASQQAKVHHGETPLEAKSANSTCSTPRGATECQGRIRDAWLEVLTLECQGGGPGVFSFDAFTQEFCRILVEEVDYAQTHYKRHLSRPNGMNNYGMVLNQLGLEPAITNLQQNYIAPLQHSLYGMEGYDPDDHHCFIVRYNKAEDVGLDMHSDSSDVTLNVCLGRDFSGSTLTFCGLVGEREHRSRQHLYTHRIGRAVIHLGRQRHGADDLEAGERLSLILWNTSRAWRSSQAYRQLMRKRAMVQEELPDLVCLSYTHDDDYTQFKEKLSRTDAVKRGVMLDRVRSDPRNRARLMAG